MAEEQGFEPWEDFHLRRFSRPVHSTTLPLLRLTHLLALDLNIHNELLLKVNYFFCATSMSINVIEASSMSFTILSIKLLVSKCKI